MKARENPSTTSQSHDIMVPRLRRSQVLLAGTEGMKAAGEDFLPMHPEETTRGWQCRLNGNVLFNFYELTLDQLAAKPFQEPIAVGEDVPEAVEEMLEDIDLQGNTLDAFAMTWFREALRGAFAGVLVDFPRVVPMVDEAGEPIPASVADVEGLRPYCVLVQPEQILSIRTERIGGAEKIVHLRIMEDVVIPDGFDEHCIEQIREIGIGYVRLWRRADPKRTNSRWTVAEEWQTTGPDVPFVLFYTDQEGLACGKPPLDDLAFLNVRHWQSMSDQIRALTVSRFPMLVVKGVYAEGTGAILRIGPEQAYNVPPDGDLKWLESTGSAIEQGRNELSDLEERMSAYGAQLLRKKPGTATATARALDTAEAMSPLQSMALSFQSALEQVLSFMAQWAGAGDEGGSVTVYSDFHGADMADAESLGALANARAIGDISRSAYIEELKRRNILVEDYDPDEDKAALDEEMAETLANQAAMTDLDPEAEEGRVPA